MRNMTKALLVMLALTLAGQANALQPNSSERGWTGGLTAPQATDAQATQRGCTTLSQAVEQVRRRTNGRIVGAETRMSGNREVHVVRVLTDDGKVKTHRIPGCTRN